MCIYTCKIEIKCTLKLSLKTQTFEGKVSAICPSLFIQKEKRLSIAAVQIWIKAPTIRSFFLKNTDILQWNLKPFKTLDSPSLFVHKII